MNYVKLTLINVKSVEAKLIESSTNSLLVKKNVQINPIEKSKSSRSSYKIKKLINNSDQESNNESNQINRKFKRHTFKLNIFSSMKSKGNKIDDKLVINKNEEKLLLRKNELMYKTI